MAKKTAVLDWKDVRKFLQGIQGKLRIPAKLLRISANIFGFKDIIDHFKRETGPNSRWRKRSDFTQQMYQQIKQGSFPPAPGVPRAAYDPGNKLLSLTGDMRMGIDRGRSKIIGSDRVILQSNKNYSGKQDETRPFMWLSNKAQSNMLKHILESAIRRR